MTVYFVGDFGRNAYKAIHVPSNWDTGILDSSNIETREPCILIAGSGSRLAESVIESNLKNITFYILVKPFRFEGKNDISDRCLSMIPAKSPAYIFDNQRLADENRNQSLLEFQKTLFGLIDASLHDIESKLQ